jgi:hypothetical protein
MAVPALLCGSEAWTVKRKERYGKDLGGKNGVLTVGQGMHNNE